MRKKRSWTIARTGLIWEAMAPFKVRLFWVFSYLTMLLFVGTLGYQTLEGWGLLDSLYMSVISITAVGFAEIHPLSDAGRVFTMILLAFSVVGLGMCWAIFTALIVEIDLGGVLERYRMEQKIKNLDGHYIICGLGRMGRTIVAEVHRMKVPFVVIDVNNERLNELEIPLDEVPFLKGDATREHTLIEAGISKARGLAACLTDDAENLMLCLTAKGIHADVEVVARANAEESLNKFRRAGVNHAISPNLTGAVRMAAALLRPSVVSFLDAAIIGTDISLRMEEAVVPPTSGLVGRTLADARIPQETGLVVIGVRGAVRGEGIDVRARYNPGPDTVLNAGDVVIVLGSVEQVEGLRGYINR